MDQIFTSLCFAARADQSVVDMTWKRRLLHVATSPHGFHTLQKPPLSLHPSAASRVLHTVVAMRKTDPDAMDKTMFQNEVAYMKETHPRSYTPFPQNTQHTLYKQTLSNIIHRAGVSDDTVHEAVMHCCAFASSPSTVLMLACEHARVAPPPPSLLQVFEAEAFSFRKKAWT
jgi:hypothetical protein